MRLHALTVATFLAAASFAGAERVYIHDKAGRLVEVKDIDLQTDPKNCGIPGKECTGGNDTCQAGQCVACNPILDWDCDSKPNATDNCDWVKNYDQLDMDMDDVGDVCDNCAMVANKDQLNTDGTQDGGDACDKDDDNDGCDDPDDDKPKIDSSEVGWRIAANCPNQVEKVWGWDGHDVDHDGRLNCMDDDDDEDGFPDSEDVCPINPGNHEFDCQRPPIGCPLTTILDACQFGGCNQFLIQIVSVIYPPVIVEQFTIRADVIIFLPMLALTIQQMEAALLEVQVNGFGAFASTPSRASGTLRLEMWTKGEDGKPKELVAKIAEYEPSQVEIREPIGDTALLVTPLEEGKAIAIQRGYTPAPQW